MKQQINYRNHAFVSVAIYDVTEFPMHFHDDPEIIFVLSGSAKLHTSFYTIETMEENNFLYINGSALHNIERISGPCRIMSIHFNMSEMAPLYGLPYFDIFTIASFDEYTPQQTIATMREHLLKIARTYYDQSADGGEALSNAALECYVYMMNNFQWYYYDDYILHNYPHRLPLSHVTRVEEVLSYLQEHHSRKLTLADVAEAHFLNKYYLSHLLKDTLGMPFQDLLNAIRLNVSLYELLDSKKSVDDIAEECGFSSGAYFRKAFSIHAKTSLSGWRKRYSKRTLTVMSPQITDYDDNSQRELLSAYEKLYCPKEEKTNILRHMPIKIELRKPPLEERLPSELYTLVLTPESLLHHDHMSDILAGTSFNRVVANRRDFAPLLRIYGSWDFLEPIRSICSRYRLPLELSDDMRFPAARRAAHTTHDLLSMILAGEAAIPAVAPPEENFALYTKNGFRTKWYYIYYLLHQLGETILYAGDSCIAARSGKTISIFCYNTQQDESITIELFLHLIDIESNYSILTYTLSCDMVTEEELWRELGSPSPASPVLKQTIRHRCFPQVSHMKSTSPYDLMRDLLIHPGEIKLMLLIPSV